MLRKKVSVLAVLIAAASASVAAELVEPNKEGPVVPKQPPRSEWSFNLSLYGWATGIDGIISARGRSADAEIAFQNVVKHLDMAFMGAAEVRYRRWVFMGDLVYARLHDDVAPPAGIVFSSTHEVIKETIGTFALSYRVVDAKPAYLDLFAGARVYSLSTEIVLRPNLGRTGIKASATATWADPIIGLRGRYYISPVLFLNGYGDIGGFGAGSELSWQLLGAVGVQATRWCDLQLGYRALGWEYSSGRSKQELTARGPIVGATFRF